MNHTLENNFKAHTVSGATASQMDHIRDECKKLALGIDELCPNGREKAVAFTKLEEVMFWANAALARE